MIDNVINSKIPEKSKYIIIDEISHVNFSRLICVVGFRFFRLKKSIIPKMKRIIFDVRINPKIIKSKISCVCPFTNSCIVKNAIVPRVQKASIKTENL